MDRWSEWKSFPAYDRGENLNAPVGPGLYELRHRHTGEVLGFGHAANVATALTGFFTPTFWKRLLNKKPPVHQRDVPDIAPWAPRACAMRAIRKPPSTGAAARFGAGPPKGRP